MLFMPKDYPINIDDNIESITNNIYNENTHYNNKSNINKINDKNKIKYIKRKKNRNKIS